VNVRPYLRRFFLFALLAGAVLPVAAFGSDDSVVAVLSSDSGPYRQAFDGFQKAFGREVHVYSLSEGEPKIPPETRVIVAFGGKAALYPYQPGPLLIYCLAPGTKIKAGEHRGGLLKIHTSPNVYMTLSKFKDLQPTLKRLAVIWAGDSIKDYVAQKKDMADRTGIEMLSDRVLNPDDLPNHLRALKGKIDAIWLPPDAFIVTPKNFATIKAFSLANNIPFYVPSNALVEQGGTASANCSFEEIGELVAQMVPQALSGSLTTDNVFPSLLHFSVNLSAAKTDNLKIPPELLKQADLVVP